MCRLYVLLPCYQWVEGTEAEETAPFAVGYRASSPGEDSLGVPAEVTWHSSVMRPSTQETVSLLGDLSLSDERERMVDTQGQRV